MHRPPRYTSIIDRAKASDVSTESALRGIAFNGLLARVTALNPDLWVVKGAQALVARNMTTRETHDLDLRFGDAAIATALDAFRAALSHSIEDGLLFRETSVIPLASANTGGPPGARVSIAADLDGSPLPRFHVDIVAGGDMRGKTEIVPFRLPINHADFPSVRVSAYPIVDHIADKVCALAATHRAENAPSSRTRDLYDLCIIRREPRIASCELGEAIEMQWLARRLRDTPALLIPSAMRAPYEQFAIKNPDQLAPPGFDDAISAVRAFVEPALDRSAPAANWNGSTLAWE